MNRYFNPSMSTWQHEENKETFKKYPVEEVPSAPKLEPEKGFTSIIIPAYFNSYPVFHYTGNCIGSIREHTDGIKTPYEIILVINGKTGINIEMPQTKVDKVIQNEENLGFAKAVNKGIRCARGEYIAIINTDVQVFNNWLPDMQEALQYLDLVMATPMYGEPFARAVEANIKRESTMSKPIQETFSDFKDFSCVLTTKELFKAVGMFDERFFMYGEDLDLIRRIEKLEGKLASTKRVNTHHIISGTASGEENTPEIMNKSKELLKEIWGF